MMKIALIIAYDGSPFFGWQKSIEGVTVEELLTDALETILQHPVILHAASRTDRGVHAEGQVVSCAIKETNLEKLQKGLNCLLPPAIRIYHIKRVAKEFHASHSALKKSYLYQLVHHPICPPLLHNRCWHIYNTLNIEFMKEGIPYLLGTHDFSAFCNSQDNAPPQNKVRTLYSIKLIERDPTSCTIEVIGNRFLYKMVRNIVGTLVYIGLKKMAPHDIKTILNKKQRALAGICAPACGLTLKEVYYDPTE